MKVFLDDERNHWANGWTHVRTVEAFFRLLDACDEQVTEISFDNDLQVPRTSPHVAVEGWEAVRDLIERRLDDPRYLPNLKTITIHSANGEAVKTMLGKLHGARDAGILEIEIEHKPAYGGGYPLAAEDGRYIDRRD